jgi:enoyl-CoA hydratase/carnithine racemase
MQQRGNKSMAKDGVLMRIDGHIARLILNNPDKHNALGEEELLLLQNYIRQISDDGQLRVLIVTGAGDKTFCAGASLTQLGTGQINGDFVQQTTDQLACLKIPTICALNGNTYGGGVELALSCDFRIGVRGTHMRVERLGVNLAKRILVAAEEFSAEDMLRLGFLDHLVGHLELQARTLDMAQSIAGLAPLAVQAMKQILDGAAQGSINIDLAGGLSRACAESDDLREGFAAQRAKRSPHFQGK